ncbi:MAG: beta-lactamase family protein [Gammaproteobacteria bacterium]|nr:beta-lactamase family protein [Gammaproteobacteria bacterium]MDH3467810.1 beta-lactamase family protein [Gammaproteobacteria bacterium]
MNITAKPEEVGLSTTRLNRIRPWLRSYIDSGKLPGAIVLVARQGQVAFVHTDGNRDIERDQLMTADTIFRIYSMTKPITSVAVMMLYERGEFQLDHPIADYIPELGGLEVIVSGSGDDVRTEPARRPITIHHLLTHTSGLTYSVFSDSALGQLYRDHRTDFALDDGPLREVVGRLAGIPLAFQPGTRWNYGVSTDVLGRLVEVISGQPLDEFFSEQILSPLAMHDSSFTITPDRLDRLAALYGYTDGDRMSLLENTESTRLLDKVSTFSGGAGLLSTMADYYRFAEMLRGKGELDGVRLLGRKTVDYMTTNHLPGDLASMGQPVFSETRYDGIGFGLGFSVMLDPAQAQVIGTPGEYAWGGMASTAFWVDPTEDMVVILLTQLMPSSSYPLRRELRVLTYQALIE